MRLILVRHAEAVNVGYDGVRSDFDRHLTAHGHTTARALANRLAALRVTVDAVATSPLVRARQTAEPLLGLIRGGSTDAVLIPELAPDTHKPKKVASALNAVGVRTLIAVSHLPDVAAFAGWLIGTGGNGVEFDKGTAAMIETGGELAEGDGSLVWLVTPNWYVERS
jgi:phosphohistidine phosphatase